MRHGCSFSVRREGRRRKRTYRYPLSFSIRTGGADATKGEGCATGRPVRPVQTVRPVRPVANAATRVREVRIRVAAVRTRAAGVPSLPTAGGRPARCVGGSDGRGCYLLKFGRSFA